MLGHLNSMFKQKVRYVNVAYRNKSSPYRSMLKGVFWFWKAETIGGESFHSLYGRHVDMGVSDDWIKEGNYVQIKYYMYYITFYVHIPRFFFFCFYVLSVLYNLNTEIVTRRKCYWSSKWSYVIFIKKSYVQ